VSAQKFVEEVKNRPGSHVGLSALLTTTMVNMEQIVKEVKKTAPDSKVLIGGAPVNEDFKTKIGADFYSPDPQGAVEFLNSVVSK
jgi:methanogenic corrinoid protein MtbC1